MNYINHEDPEAFITVYTVHRYALPAEGLVILENRRK